MITFVTVSIHQIKSFVLHQLVAGNRHRVHSPFLYEFVDNTIYDDNSFYSFDKIEGIKSALTLNETELQIDDYGAGSSKFNKLKIRKVSDILKISSCTQQKGELLFKLVNASKSKNILELGTCLGISTLYLGLQNSESKVWTIEACESLYNMAQFTFKAAELKNVIASLGTFDQVLDGVLKDMGVVDFAYIDGNHSYKPTVDYFQKILPYLQPNSIVVLDDIYWSKGMTKAWHEIKSSPEVKVSIDLFELGILLFREELSTEHYKLKMKKTQRRA